MDRTSPKLALLFLVLFIAYLSSNHGPSYTPRDESCDTFGRTLIAPDVFESFSLQTIPKHPSFSLIEAWVNKAESARFTPPPTDIPAVLKDGYSMDNRVPINVKFLDQAYLGAFAQASQWTYDYVESFRGRIRRREEKFNYVMDGIYAAMDTHAETFVKGKRGLVIGSENPWAEALLLEYGALSVSTLEFGYINSTHPQISTFIPRDFTACFLGGTIQAFDFAFTYSSLEHDGLGRYGDVLDPNGDLLTLGRLLSVVKPGGVLFLGLPCCQDELWWNAHRIYGPIRIPKLFAGWFPYHISGHFNAKVADASVQPLWTLRNELGCSSKAVASLAGIMNRAISYD
jgi:hypothetical protein